MFGKEETKISHDYNLRSKLAEVPSSGGDYVDLELRVKIVFTEGSMIVYQSDKPHATTPVHKYRSHGVCNTNSRHISDAKKQAGKDGGMCRELVQNAIENTFEEDS